jgi:hypothetical protein
MGAYSGGVSGIARRAGFKPVKQPLQCRLHPCDRPAAIEPCSENGAVTQNSQQVFFAHGSQIAIETVFMYYNMLYSIQMWKRAATDHFTRQTR